MSIGDKIIAGAMVLAASTCVFVLGAAIWGLATAPHSTRNAPLPSFDDGPNITHVGPRVGFDGRIRLLPGLMPGIGF